MIRTTSPEDEQRLEILYKDSIYGELLWIVRRALSVRRERVSVVEEKR